MDDVVDNSMALKDVHMSASHYIQMTVEDTKAHLKVKAAILEVIPGTLVVLIRALLDAIPDPALALWIKTRTAPSIAISLFILPLIVQN